MLTSLFKPLQRLAGDEIAVIDVVVVLDQERLDVLVSGPLLSSVLSIGLLHNCLLGVG